MLDVFDLPTNQKTNQQIFYANSPIAGANWITWVKPRGVNFVQFFMLGGGGGGGGGFSGAVGASFGGAGGASSNQYNFLFPASALPDVLYLSVGKGGTIGAVASSGGAGVASYISIYPSTVANLLLGICSGGLGGGPGSASAAGFGGAALAAKDITAAPLAALGMSLCTTTVGNITVAGQAGALGFSGLTLPITGLVVTGGCGGATMSASGTAGSQGGSFTAPAGSVFPACVGGAGGATANAPGVNGSNGLKVPGLLYFYGGAGGGSGSSIPTVTSAAYGGSGGAGAFGCGGGGGGGGFTGSTNGIGGAGGDGIIIVTAF